ncbi:MAG: DUF721 domain-containing protein [Candidatus Kapaibacteriota bacterium]|jgi:hypothetical protein
MLTLQNIIEDIFNKNGREDILLKSKISAILSEVLGENIAKNIKVKSIRKGKLYLQSNNSIWAFEISIHKDMIIKKLNEFLGKEEIKDIISR